MTNKKPIKKGISAGKAVAIGASVAALGAGAYYFLGPNGKSNQKKAKVWMNSMEKEVAKKWKSVKDATEPLYKSTVDAIATTYSKQYKEHAPAIKAYAAELKTKWKGAEKKAKSTAVKAKKVVKKTISKAKSKK